MPDRLFENWKNAKVDSIDDFIANAPVMMHSTESNGRLAYISRPWAARLGYTVAEMVGARLPDFMTDESKHQAMTIEIPRFLRTGWVENLEYDFLCKDGSVFPVLMSSIARYKEDGSFANSLAVVSDNSAKKYLEIFERKAEQAERENGAKTRFLANMSHELRTPLNAIIGFAQMINGQGGEITSDQRIEYSNYIMDSGTRLLKLINQVLDLSSIEAGSKRVALKEVDVKPLINAVMNEVSVLAHPRNILLIDTLAEKDVPLIMADDERLMQAIVNLVANAVKYNRENGEVQVSASSNGRTLRINVEDTGQGIPVNRHAEVFETFNRLGAEVSDLEGTGVGLSIAKEYVEKMGGTIGFTSVSGVGSNFWIELALAEQTSDAMTDEDWAHTSVPGYPASGPSHRTRMTIAS